LDYGSNRARAKILGQPMEFFCHVIEEVDPKRPRKRCVPIPMILSKIVLIFLTTLDCKLHQNAHQNSKMT